MTTAVDRLRLVFAPGVLWRLWHDATSGLARLDLVNSVGRGGGRGSPVLPLLAAGVLAALRSKQHPRRSWWWICSIVVYPQIWGLTR
jgi:hypothetical protein